MATAALRKQQRTLFSTIHSEGTLLPVDILQRIEQLNPGLPGLTAHAYHVDGYKLNEEINDAWLRALRDWHNFQAALSDPIRAGKELRTTLDLWLRPLLNKALSYGNLPAAQPIYLEHKDKRYPISYSWGQVPIHLVSYSQKLDEKETASLRNSPYSLVQELLNNSNDHLWGIVSNGKILRLLRRNVSLTRQAYVEFNLEEMMQGESYADFALFWLLCHQSRFEGERPADCWLEQWTRAAQENGVRALDQLREGVESAINALGKGFLTCTAPANFQLRTKLREGTLSPQEYYRQVLRLVYRLIILFVAEDRDVLFHPDASAEAKQRYLSYYSTRRLRQLAEQRIGTRHTDLFRGLWIVMEKLGTSDGYPALGLPALNGFLFSRDSVRDLTGCELSNYALLDAIRSLATTLDKGVRRTVDYKNLGAEELGSVYESLLELHPDLVIGESGVADFKLKLVTGNERKTSGSYYTPTSLIDCLLDSALDPVLHETIQGKSTEEAQQAILDLKVCDPACGSGHFLIAAAHRIAKKLAAVRTGDEEPGPEERRRALRDVVGRCIYGVDINPMSVELCKVNLWMETIDPGKPLSFLDSHILCGNSLLGTTPMLMKNGIPDSAFEYIEGDDKKVCSALKKLNKTERTTGQMNLWASTMEDISEDYEKLVAYKKQLEEMPDDSVANVHRKQEWYNQIQQSTEYQEGKLQANAWCAAFVWKKVPNNMAITYDVFRNIQQNRVSKEMGQEIQRLTEQYKFFHWHLEFPEVFGTSTNNQSVENKQTGWSGGFDVVLGNPPWERIKFQEKEWFASRHRSIANAANGAQRQQLIKKLAQEDPYMYASFLENRRKSEGEGHFLRDSSRYPLCGRGDINTYAVFSENLLEACAPKGRVGCIVPSGIATDDTTKFFFQYLVEVNHLVSLFDFENRFKIFPAVDSRVKFCLLTLTGSSQQDDASIDFMFFAQTIEDLKDSARRFTLSAEDISLLNPNTKTCPIFRSRRDAELNLAIYRNLPALIDESKSINDWGVYYIRLVHLGDHANYVHFKWERENANLPIPLYESKLFHQFDHRYGTFDDVNEKDCIAGQPRKSTNQEKGDPSQSIVARYYLSSSFSHELFNKYPNYNHPWLILWRDVTRSTDERTCIVTIIPKTLASVTCPALGFLSMVNGSVLTTNLNSFVFDYVARQKVGGIHMTFSVLKQLPVINPDIYLLHAAWDNSINLYRWTSARMLELTYNAWDLEAFAKDCGYDGPPFRWDEERRFLLRCELDAAYFHLYDISRKDVGHIMETFPIVKRKDEKEYGEYRTKRVILEIFDELQQAIYTGVPYQTRLDPPPADPMVAHPPRVVEA